MRNLILAYLFVWWITGVKDARDKKILVDMLFWAVDNPVPANYLLISGSTDFSYALLTLLLRLLLLENLHDNLLLEIPTHHVNIIYRFQFLNLHQQTNLLMPMPILMLPKPKVYMILDIILMLKLFTYLRTRINWPRPASFLSKVW